MKDILKYHEQSKIYQLLFSTFEQEAIQMLNTIPVNEKCFAILNKKIYQRFTKLCPALRDNPKIMSYNKSLKELYQDDHPLRQHYSSDSIKHSIKRNKIGLQNRSFMLTVETFGLYLIEAPVVFSDDSNLPKTSALIKQNLVGWTNIQFSKYYLEIANDLSIKESIISSATTLGETSAKLKFNNNLEFLMWAILRNTREASLTHLLGVFLDIGIMNFEQINKFVCDYYSKIPYTGNRCVPSAAVGIRKRGPVNSYNERNLKELFIKGDGYIAHIEVDYDFGSTLRFDIYDTGDKEIIKLFGHDYCMDDYFLEGMHLDLFLMVTCDYKDVEIITDFSFDFEQSLAISMTEEKGSGLYDYLLDMEGKYHRLAR
jgi:hypothetical protein